MIRNFCPPGLLECIFFRVAFYQTAWCRFLCGCFSTRREAVVFLQSRLCLRLSPDSLRSHVRDHCVGALVISETSRLLFLINYNEIIFYRPHRYRASPVCCRRSV